uniref:30S ribosomal protein S4 n=1 Tax=Lygus hesperus TaxID=30085 RepID=A0A0A9Y589_LYGHE
MIYECNGYRNLFYKYPSYPPDKYVARLYGVLRRCSGGRWTGLSVHSDSCHNVPGWGVCDGTTVHAGVGQDGMCCGDEEEEKQSCGGTTDTGNTLHWIYAHYQYPGHLSHKIINNPTVASLHVTYNILPWHGALVDHGAPICTSDSALQYYGTLCGNMHRSVFKTALPMMVHTNLCSLLQRKLDGRAA